MRGGRSNIVARTCSRCDDVDGDGFGSATARFIHVRIDHH